MGKHKPDGSPIRHKSKKQKREEVVVKKKPKRPAYGAVWSTSRERKDIGYVDTAAPAPSSNALTWSTPVLVNAVAQGFGAQNYIGRSLMLKKISFRYNFSPNTTNVGLGGGGFLQRFVLIYDKSVENAALPTITDIFETDTWDSYMNLNNSTRFCVLYDKIVHCAPDSSTTNVSNGTVFFKGNIKLNHIMEFQGTAANIASIQKGAIYAITAQNARWDTSGLTPGVRMTVRSRFIDS